MQTIQTIMFVLQVLVALSLIGFILIQHGKGADAGAAFGSGASSTIFGARGSGNFLSRATAVLAFVFLANSLGLGYIATQRVKTEPTLLQQQADSVIMQEQVDTPASPPEDATDIPQVPDTATAPVTTDSDVPALPEN